MAFISPTPIHSSLAATNLAHANATDNKLQHQHHHALPLSSPRATAIQPNRQRQMRTRKSAPVVDTRVASRKEAHHWVVVMDHSRRLFERAAVAQVDVARELEAREGIDNKALHRWVLRETSSHPFYDNLESSGFAKLRASGASRYLVTESFDSMSVSPRLTRRWLSAVERVGPLISTVDIRSLQYSDVFTSKIHDVKFNPQKNIVVIHSYNTEANNLAAQNALVAVLSAKSERAVAIASCLEFGVLQSNTQPSLFKTVEIFQDANALEDYAVNVDKLFTNSIKAHIVDDGQHRHVFKPVVFS